MDRYLEMVFAEIGSVPPDRRFVRYEWLESADVHGGAMVEHQDGSSIITSGRLIDEHELAHAVHFQAWPKTRPVFHEGFAVLFDSHSGRAQAQWPSGEPLDPLLEKTPLGHENYGKAWFLVSQIVRDHGMDGLNDLWHAVAPQASAAEVRQAYQDLFGRSIDALIEPIEGPGGLPEERWSCYFTVCGEPQPWDGNAWRADGPFACADDPDALGPLGAGTPGTVERYHVVELEPATRYRFTASSGGAELRPCGLQCQPRGSSAHTFWPDMPSSRADLPGGPYRVEIVSLSDDLPTDTPATFEIERLD